MNPATFLKNTERIVTGQGFKRIIPGITLSSWKNADGLELTAATEPRRASAETVFEAVTSYRGTTVGGSLQFVVPRDYDQTVDKLKIRFLAQSSSSETPTIDAVLYRKRAGAAISGDLDPTISAAINSATAKAAWVEINCDDLGMQPGDALHFDFTFSTHSSHEANMYGLEVEYRSDLVYYDKTDRS